MIFCSVLWQVTKAGFTISSLKRNGSLWNGTICILHQRRRRRQCHQLRRWWSHSSGMQRVLILAEFLERGQNITASRYVQTLHKFRRALRYKRPGRNLIILHENARPTLLASHRTQLQRLGGKFFHTPPIALIWHPPITIFPDLWSISCVDNVMRQRRQFRKQCVSVFGWLERSSTAGEFSNFQNAGRNVYKEVAIMWKKGM